MPTKIRMEGFTLTVKDVTKSAEFYKQFGYTLEWNAAPHFAMLRIGGPKGGTMGLLSWTQAKKDGCTTITKTQARATHVELSTDDLDGLYKVLLAKGVKFHAPPHDEPWERAMTAFDPDGYSVEIAQGRRGQKTKPKAGAKKKAKKKA